MRTVRSHIVFAAALLVTLCAARPAYSVEYVLNGDFTASGTGWTSEGPTFFDGDTGSLTDAGSISGVCDDFQCSRFYQRVAVVNGTYTLQFDFLNLLTDNPDLPNGDMVFPDVIFASLYLTDNALLDPNAPSPIQSDPDPVLLTAQFDGNTPSATGSIGASAKGGDWLHFSQVFSTTNLYAYIVFELFGLDMIAEESTFKVDNVSIAKDEDAVPEPATLSLLSAGILSAFGLRRKNKA